ncbi:hypothetical protein COHA_000570 [Chlorella ohadii]|uniref:Uncharacterized protein n=1 Tax=Chlorella ohadii TaxID=2649997 RepID=A0AAD5H918_9CHLO|nr:hypothetical protein COHA_000570 [Chlorella ohadii]
MAQAAPKHTWADDVEEDEAEELQRRAQAAPSSYQDYGDDEEAFREGRYEPRDGWHEGMDVQRGASRARLNLQHGFMRDIVRNQRDRDAYEKAWQEAHAQADEYQKKWGRAKVQRDGKEWGM